MSQVSRLRKSLSNWKCKAVDQTCKNRYLRRELKRVKKDRDQLKTKLKDTQSCQHQLANQSQGLVFEHKESLVFLALLLFLVAHIGFRAVSRVLGVFAKFFGLNKAPCPQTIINWVTRLSMVRIQSLPILTEIDTQQAPFYNGMIWMIDMSIALGTGKILAILGLNVRHHQFSPNAPGFENVHCVAVSVADSWTGDAIAAFIKQIISVTGRPAAYLKDGGTDLKKAIRLLKDEKLESPAIDDISHVIANMLKHRYHHHPFFETFLSSCGHISGKLKQTILACLAPPKVQTKARFMNVHRLIDWADQLLSLSPPGAAAKGSILSKLRACLDKLPLCKAFIKQFKSDATPLLACQKILKTKGLSYDSLAQCEPHIQAITSSGLRCDFQSYLQKQMEIAKTLNLDKVGLPISSDQIESLFGLAKQHGTGQIKDADRIALRIPAMCGTVTLEDAKNVLGISVSDQKEVMDCYTSIIKQRCQILTNSDHLESLGTEQSRKHVTLIPMTKNRSKNDESTDISYYYPDSYVPDAIGQYG